MYGKWKMENRTLGMILLVRDTNLRFVSMRCDKKREATSMVLKRNLPSSGSSVDGLENLKRD